MTRLAALLLLACAWAGTATAQGSNTPPDGLETFIAPDPAFGLGSADRVFLVYEEACGRPEIDIGRVATVADNDNQFLVDIYLIDRPDTACLSAPPPPRLVYIGLGQLPKGRYSVTRRLHVRTLPADEHVLTSTQTTVVRIEDTPHRAVSGAWYDPANPGTGLFVAIIPQGQIVDEGPDPDLRPYAALYLAELESAGQPAWSTGLSRFEDGVLRISMTDAGGQSPSRVLLFTYTGCGRATIADAQSPEIVTELEQVTRIDGVPNCVPPGAF